MTTATTHAWQAMYPPRQIHAHGWLAVGDGHQIYWEECGNPLGQAALFLHGGPGAGCTPDDRRWFDPRHYRIVLFDQRGAGRSWPRGGLGANTTDHLVRDIEALRQHLQIERWLLFGGSWGATLALSYAQSHPQRTRALVMRGVFTATAAERRALYGANWRELLESLAARLSSGDAAAEQAAARTWRRWEERLMDHESPPVAAKTGPEPAAPDRAMDVAAARIGVHYAQHAYFLREGQLLSMAARLCTVPGVIVQGARDRVTPPAAARALHRAWPAARLHWLAKAGHGSRHPEMAQALVAATAFFVAPAQSQHPPGDPDERRLSAP